MAGFNPNGRIEIRDLDYAYPDGTAALNRLSLDIPMGCRTAILGANGSGKSTLLRHLNGLIVPQAGQVSVGGIAVTRQSADTLRRQVGLLFDQPDHQLFSYSVEADVRFGPSNLKMGKAEVVGRAAAAMELVGILDLKYRAPHHLSLGQKKRCAIAGVLAMTPAVLLMDEPFSGLDPVSVKQFRAILDRLSEDGITSIMSTHDVDLAYEWADYIVILQKGSALAAGGIELLRDPALMSAADLSRPLLVRLFEGTGVMPDSFEAARRQLSIWLRAHGKER